MIRSDVASRRISAIHDLERLGPEDPEVAIPALSASLEDTDPAVRAAAAIALGVAGLGTEARGAVPADVTHALALLLSRLKDPEATVRAAAAQGLWMIASGWNASDHRVDILHVKAALIRAAVDPDPGVRFAALRGLGAIAPKVGDDPPLPLAAALEDPSEKVRVGAAESLLLFRRGLPPMLPTLVRSFEKARPDVRPAYASVLGRIRPRAFQQAAIPALASALTSHDDEIRCLAATSLAAFGEDAHSSIPSLVSSISRPSTAREVPGEGLDPVLAAARAILKITPENALARKPGPPIDPESLAALAEVLRSGRPSVRAAVAASLGRFRPTSAVIPVLGKAVEDPDAAVRAAALRALHDIGDAMSFVPPPTLRAALEDESGEVRYWAAGALGHAGLGIDPYVADLLRHAEHDPDARVRAVCALEVQECIKPPAVTTAMVPVVTLALDNPDPRVRCAACGMLGTFGPASAQAIPALVELLRHSTSGRQAASAGSGGNEQRAWAATALGKIAPGTLQADRAASALLESFQAGSAGAPTIPVINALARFGPLAHAAIPRLRELQKSRNVAVSESARRTLAILEDSD
jgi:HEAT repeat protein